jgi:hypothetical protein
MKNKIILIIIIILTVIAAYYYQLELATIAYLGLNILINNLESISNYLKDFLGNDVTSVPNIEDNSIIEVSENNKPLDTNLDKSTILPYTITTEEITPFYKSKPFIICGIIIITSSLIYLYFNSPTNIFGGSYESKLVDKLLDIIKQKDEKLLDVIYDKESQFYENNNKLLDIIYQKEKIIHQLEHIVRQSNIRWRYSTDEVLDILD